LADLTQTVLGTVPAGANQEQWYQFTTLGDGQADSQIRLGNAAEQSAILTLGGKDGTLTPTTGGFTINPSGSSLTVGGTNGQVGILEFDLSRFLDRFAD